MELRIKKLRSLKVKEKPIIITVNGVKYVNPAAACIMLGLSRAGLSARVKRWGIRALGGSEGVGYSEDCFFSLERLRGTDDESLDDVPGLITIRNFCKKYGIQQDYFTNAVLAKLTKSKELRAVDGFVKNSLVIEAELLDLLASEGVTELEAVEKEFII